MWEAIVGFRFFELTVGLQPRNGVDEIIKYNDDMTFVSTSSLNIYLSKKLNS